MSLPQRGQPWPSIVNGSPPEAFPALPQLMLHQALVLFNTVGKFLFDCAYCVSPPM